MKISDYPGLPPSWDWKGKKEGKILSFPSWISTPFPENNRVWVDVWEPEKIKAGVIILHSWGENRGGYSERMAERFYEENFLVFRPHLPYHIRRTPSSHSSGSLFLTLNLEHSLTSFRQAVVDVRTLLDIISRVYPGISIGGVGLSLGAIILLTLLGVEERVSCGVSVLGGGNLTDIVARGVATLPLMIAGFFKGLRLRHYREVKKEFQEFLKEVRVKGVDKVSPRWEWFLFDPLTYARPGKRVLFINALFDLVIPRSCVLSLWRKMGEPPIIWIPTSHFTSFLFFPFILRKTLEFLKENLPQDQGGLNRG